jgi:hypothetical protein
MWGVLSDEDGSVVCTCCWPSPALSFSSPSPLGLATILLSQIPDFPFCGLLRLTGLRWRYLTPPLHRIVTTQSQRQRQSQRQSQSYFTTGSILPIRSSWRKAPWDSRPEFFSQLNTCGHSPYYHIVCDERMGM